MHTIIEERDGFETIRREKPYEIYSLWSGSSLKERIFMSPIYFIFWMYEFLRLYRSKYKFEITVYKRDK